MQTYPTLEEARIAAKASKVPVREIAKIVHRDQGDAYICCRASVDVLRAALRKTPLPEIVSIVSAHPVLTPEEAKAEHEQHLRDHTSCERCHAKIDGNTAYHQTEHTRFGGKLVDVVAYYCDNCRRLLAAIGAGEYTAIQERADEKPSYEPYTKDEDDE
jgi:hypothetical protein